MHWDVTKVEPLPDYRIYVELLDGRKGTFDLKPYLDHGVFRELREVAYFNQVGTLLGAVTWPHEQASPRKPSSLGFRQCRRTSVDSKWTVYGIVAWWITGRTTPDGLPRRFQTGPGTPSRQGPTRALSALASIEATQTNAVNNRLRMINFAPAGRLQESRPPA
jgi:hypothetical protein